MYEYDDLLKLGVSDDLLLYLNKNKDTYQEKDIEYIIKYYINDDIDLCIKICESIENKRFFSYILLLININTLNIPEAQGILKYLKKSNSKYFNKVDIYYNIFVDNNSEFHMHYEDNEYVKDLVQIFKKYIKLGQYKIAYKILLDLINIDESFKDNLLESTLSKLQSKTEYIIDETDFTDELVIENLKSMEERMLILFEYKKYDDALKIASKLRYIYQDNLALDAIANFVFYIKEMLKDDNFVSRHNFTGVLGDIDGVIKALLDTRDFYRVNDIVNSIDGNIFSIKYQIYKILSKELFQINENNMNHIKERLMYSIDEDIVKETLTNKHLSSININMMHEIENKNNFDENKDYYSLYKEKCDEKDYVSALDALKKYIVSLEMMGSYDNVDYLIDELEILIFNENDSEHNKEEARKFLRLGDEAYNNCQFRKSLMFYLEYSKMVKRVIPRVLGKIANCYNKIADHENAIYYYDLELKNGMLPDDYKDYIYLLFKQKMYSDAIDVFDSYDKYNQDDDLELYYVMSICYMETSDYENALDCLDTCEIISAIDGDIEFDYKKERRIIKKLQSGTKADKYNLDDLVNPIMTKDEIELYECVRNLNEEYSDDFIYHMDKLYSNITDKEEFINRLSKLMKIIFINYDVKISKCFLTLLNNKLFEMNITEDRYYKKLNKYNI